MNTERDREDARTLEILDVIDRQKDVSQRHLARHLGVALGLANSYLKRCVRKGLIKVSHAPANRYLYYLTPTGFAEKSRLTAEYLSHSLSFYRKAGDSCLRAFDQCKANGWKRLLLCGVSELAEIATLKAMERDIAIVGYLDSASDRKRFLNRPVWTVFNGVEKFDGCMLTDLHAPQASYRQLRAFVGQERILAPDVLTLDMGDGQGETLV
jgi:DNA-binding MarR family transcriptional regulator